MEIVVGGVVLPWCITVLVGAAVVVDNITDVGGGMTIDVVVCGTVGDVVELVVSGTVVAATVVEDAVTGTVVEVVVEETVVDVGETIDELVVG